MPRKLVKIKKTVGVVSVCGPSHAGKVYVFSTSTSLSDTVKLGYRLDPKLFGIWIYYRG